VPSGAKEGGVSVSAQLTNTERGTLQHCEAEIQRGLESFVEVGTALMRIRDGRLYRDGFETFEAYCEQKWNLSRPRAYQLIEASEAVRAVSTNVDISPKCEAHARPLTLLPTPKAQVSAWKEAVKTAPKNDAGEPVITARHVEQVVRERMTEKPERSVETALQQHQPQATQRKSPPPQAIRVSPTSLPSQWDGVLSLLAKARSQFDLLIAERRDNSKSEKALALFEQLEEAVVSYRKSILRGA